MTCIVGLVNKDQVLIAGDSIGSDGRVMMERRDKKVFENGGMIFGVSGTYRGLQLLQYALTVPVYAEAIHGSVDKFMRTAFVEAVRACLKAGGEVVVTNAEDRTGVAALVGAFGRLWTIDGDFQVGEPDGGYYAAGAGYMVALGSLFSDHRGVATDDQMALGALQAAAHHTCHVRGPFTMATLDKKGAIKIGALE